MKQLLEHQRELHALAMRKAEAEAEKAELERDTARIVYEHVRDHAKWTELPKLGGGIS